MSAEPNPKEEKMGKFTLPVVIAAVVIIAGVAISAARADGGDSQNFAPSRYALVTGTIEVAMLQPGANVGKSINTRDVILKIDTVTGDTWVLQLGINGVTDPTVRSAVWAPVETGIAFTPFDPAPQPVADPDED